MNVELVSYTPDALTLLLGTKNTRLATADDPALWSDAKRAEHLAYMRDTIKSSWEFVDYVFDITGVTRAFTHQLVRTRTGAYAQQTMRALDVREQEVVTPFSIENDSLLAAIWEAGKTDMMNAYAGLIDEGADLQDARGLLPTNISTSIKAKFNLRTLSGMAEQRLCVRTAGEYQDVFRAMRAAVLAVHPWADDFLQVACVANGTCAFPRYGKELCPVYDPAMDQTAVKKKAKEIFWGVRHFAVPVAADGKTM
jgi:thymidylate synthase ThyX